MPGLLIRCIFAGGVRGVETERARFPLYHESCRDDVPKVFSDDINRQEIEFSQLVGLAGTAGPDYAYVASFRALADC